MKRWTLWITIPLLLAAGAAAEEFDLSGSWTLTIQGKTPPGKNFALLAFENGDDGLVVKMRGKGGEIGAPVTFEDDRLTFEHTAPEKKAAVAVFSGRVHGDLMGGVVDMGSRGQSAWQAIRDGGPDLSGTWTFMQKGLPMDYENLTKLHFHQDGHELVATFTTGDSETVCVGHLRGDSVGFSYSRRTGDGKTFGAKYAGRINGDLISGEVEMGEQGKSTWRATRDAE